MRLAVSNIAWPAELDEEMLDRLPRLGVDGIEVAPTRLWPDWVGMSRKDAQHRRRRFEAAGLCVPAFQAILYGRPELRVFGDDASRAALLNHLDKVFAVAAAIGAGVLVFGSPKNRDKGELDEDVAFDIAVGLFRAAGQRADAHGTVLCIEPNPPQYGSNFVTGWREAARLVRAVNSSGFGLHLDTACIHMNGDSPAEAIIASRGFIHHLHISEPGLADFSSPDVRHREVAAALRSIGYSGWASIEMRCGNAPLAAVEQAVGYVNSIYQSGGRQ